jgi:hypothetical protein
MERSPISDILASIIAACFNMESGETRMNTCLSWQSHTSIAIATVTVIVVSAGTEPDSSPSLPPIDATPANTYPQIALSTCTSSHQVSSSQFPGSLPTSTQYNLISMELISRDCLC